LALSIRTKGKEVDMDSVDGGPLVLRLFLELLMVAHGSQKLFGWVQEFGHLPPHFDQPGTYAYACTIHPGMEGEVIVK
jgi:uncharacterized membrane protein YphA (DoxX/SURF4 family)